MKYLILFLILIFFMPIISGEPFDINIVLKDSEGTPVNSSKLTILEFNGTVWENVSGVTQNGTISDFRFTFEEKEKERCFLVYFYKYETYIDDESYPDRNIVIEGSGIICPRTNQNYSFTVNEIGNKPAANVLYNMSSTSLNMAKESKKMAYMSFILALFAFIITCLSTIFKVKQYLITIIGDIIKKIGDIILDNEKNRRVLNKLIMIIFIVLLLIGLHCIFYYENLNAISFGIVLVTASSISIFNIFFMLTLPKEKNE